MDKVWLVNSIVCCESERCFEGVFALKSQRSPIQDVSKVVLTVCFRGLLCYCGQF